MKRFLLASAFLLMPAPRGWGFGFGLGKTAAQKSSTVVEKGIAKSSQTTVNTPNNGNTGSPPEPVAGISVKWAYIGEPIYYSSPAVAPDGTVYFGTSHHFQYYSSYWRQGQKPPPKPYGLYAYHPDGTLRWKYFAGPDLPVRGSTSIGPDGTLYTIFERLSDAQWKTTEELHALTPDGALKWKVEISTYYSEIGNLTPSIGDDGTIYVAGRDTIAYRPDGTEKWRHTGEYVYTNLFYGAPAIGKDGTIYTVVWSTFSPYGQSMHALNPDGTMRWASPNLGTYPISCSPSIAADGTIYIGIHDTQGLAGVPDTNPGETSALIAVDASSGGIKWAFAAHDFDVRSSPSIDADGTIYFGTKGNNGFVYAVNPDGSKKWSYATNHEAQDRGGTDVYNTPAIGVDGTIYAYSEWGYLYAFRRDGSLKWKDNALLPQYGGGEESSPTITQDGTLYIGKGYGAFMAVHTDTLGLSLSAQWPRFHRDDRNSGRAR